MNAPDASRRRFNVAVVAAALGASIPLVGCDKKSGTSSSADARLTKLRMQSPWINDAEFIGYFIAIDEGMYRQDGLDLTYLPGGPDKVADLVLASKNAEIALTNPETTINMIIKEKVPFKIIGTQYQKSPLGIVSLTQNKISNPKDLIGRKVAVPDANLITLDAFLKLNGIDPKSVNKVPYAYDPTPLVKGQVDATVDFVTNVPFSIRQAGQEPTSFLFYDFGFRVFMDTVVVREETLASQRDALLSFLRASRKGWAENFANPDKWPPKMMKTHFAGTNRTVENEIYFNRAQQSLMQSTAGFFSMSEADIQATVESLNQIGLKATREMFDTTLLAQI